MYRLHMDSGDFQAALRAAEAARKASKAPVDLLRAAAALAPQPSQALPRAQEALEEWRGAGRPRGEAEALKVVAQLQRLAGDWEAALEAAEERVALLRRLEDDLGEADALQAVAQLHMADGNLEEAMKVGMARLASY